MMKFQIKYFSILILALTFVLTGCRKDERIEYGPRGYDGQVFFGVSYSSFPPYSYGDNNPSIPFNPTLGETYASHPGLYHFEYFINPFEYWEGTYELWINPGGPGGEFGTPGLDGRDNFLMLICDPQGYYEDRFMGKMIANYQRAGQKDQAPLNYKVNAKKYHVNDRKPKLPIKYEVKSK